MYDRATTQWAGFMYLSNNEYLRPLLDASRAENVATWQLSDFRVIKFF